MSKSRSEYEGVSVERDAYLIDEVNRILAEENERFERARFEAELLAGGPAPDPTDDGWTEAWEKSFEESTRDWEERN